MGKSWDMIEAEVAALALPELRAEARAWVDVSAYDDVEASVREADDAVEYAVDAEDADPLALASLRGWVTHRREAFDGRSPDELG